jgi:hypothetical protein
MDGGVNGAKLQFVQKAYADSFSGKGNHVLCIITDKENVRTVAARDFVSKKRPKVSPPLQMQQAGQAVL